MSGCCGSPNVNIVEHDQKKCNPEEEKPNFCAPIPQKDPFPLMSFRDTGLAYTCTVPPVVIQSFPRRAITTWKVNYLVSNVNTNEATHIDLNLVCPRGIIVHNNQLWVANMMSDKITNYDLFGNVQLGAIQTRNNRRVASFPSGIAINCSGNFSYDTGLASSASQFALMITPTKTGDVIAYNPNVNELLSDVVLNIRITGGINLYTGVAIVGNMMYLVNFFQGRIDVYDGDYNPMFVTGRVFIDNYGADPIPEDYTPFNITYIEPYLYVTYAQRDPRLLVAEMIGPGKGYISVFSLDGGFIRRFASRGPLNAPWSIIPAPIGVCGIPEGSFFVSNIGSGRIITYDKYGNDLGPLLSTAGLPIVIDGIQSITPYYTDINAVYFTSSSDPQTRGLLGRLDVDQVIYV
jgi:uncharacterized protein (TIGR03118 family)